MNKENQSAESSQNTTPGKKEAASPAAKKEATPLKKKQVLAGGVISEELKEGHGPEAKAGKMVHVYYKGTLQNGKQFDACILGKQEVIKGWDNGLSGMKVGGKRKLVIPPSQGYGSSRTGPIPPNSTLTFEVELKAVS